MIKSNIGAIDSPRKPQPRNVPPMAPDSKIDEQRWLSPNTKFQIKLIGRLKQVGNPSIFLNYKIFGLSRAGARPKRHLPVTVAAGFFEICVNLF